MNTVDATAEAINKCKWSIADMQRAGERLRESLDAADDHLRKIIAIDDHRALLSLRARIERIQELRRSMELGSLMVESTRATDAAWKRLP